AWFGALVEQPAVGGLALVHRDRVAAAFGQQAVAHEQGPHAGGLGQMAEHLAVRVDRAADEAPAVQAEKYPVRSGPLRHQPHRRPAARLDLGVVDLARFGGEVPPRLVVGSLPLWPGHGQPGRLPAPPDRLGLLAWHRVSPFLSATDRHGPGKESRWSGAEAATAVDHDALAGDEAGAVGR